jgi:hypothetical protein
MCVQDNGSHDILLVPSTGGEASIVPTLPFDNVVPLGEQPRCVPVELHEERAFLCTVGGSVSDAWIMGDFDPTRSR